MQSNQPAERHTAPRNRLLRIGLVLTGVAITIFAIGFLANVVVFGVALNKMPPNDPSAADTQARAAVSLAFDITRASLLLVTAIGTVAVTLIAAGLINALRNRTKPRPDSQTQSPD